ncbi:cache domain-containing protein [Sphingosinicella sp.]|uniref:cache domain-containing protein n=1 Tax=Sphingosinicella sp. TaxID=1917971 RepID=UPI004037EF09
MMRFRRAAPRALIVAVGLVILVLTLGSNLLFGGMTTTVERNQIELMRSIIAFNIEGAGANALARAEMTASDPLVRELLARRDRPGLLAHTLPMFLEQRDKYGVDQVQFHLAPATSFLRLQAPERHSDDLSRFRPMVVAVNRERTARRGVAVASTGPAVFGVAPVRDPAGNHVGSVEFGLDFGALLDRLKAAYGLELTLFIDEGPLRTYARGIRPGVISEQNRVGTTMRLHSTNWTLMQDLVNGDDLRIHDETRDWVRDAGGTSYGVVLYPLRDGSGQTLGAIAVARSFESTRGAAGRSNVLQILFALLGFVALVGVILIVVRGYLVRPLAAITARFATVGTDERPEPDEDDRFLAEEMQALAEEHRRIADLVEGKRKR